MTNTRFALSRNKREGWYTGKHRECKPDKAWNDQKIRHFRSKLFFKSLKENRHEKD